MRDAKDAKPGFDNQWIEIFATGSHTDSEGRPHTIDHAFLKQAAANFAADKHQPPIVIGHPKENAPAWGWMQCARVNGDRLEAQFVDVDPQFEAMVRQGRFKKRSASFYLDADGKPTVRHIGFLGAQPPAVKGLTDIQFAEGESLTFDGELTISDFSEDETMKDEDVTTITERVLAAIKGMFTGKPPEGGTTNFSETAVKKLVEDSVKAATASFGEKVAALEAENKTLAKTVDAHASKVTRAEILAFVEKQGNAKLPPALRSGLVEFMETLDGGSERKVIVIEFTEDGGVKKETKTEFSQLAYFKEFIEKLPAFIAFGEQFGSLAATGTEGVVVDEGRVNAMRTSMGLKVEKK